MHDEPNTTDAPAPDEDDSTGFDPGLMTDGSAKGPAGEPIDPSGGSADGGESGQDAGRSS